MSRFNEKSSEKFIEKNYEGDISYKLTPEMELYTLVCTSALQPTFYVPNTNDQLNKIKSALRRVDPLFAAQLAVYARERMYLRTIPLILTIELTKLYKKQDDLVRRLVRRVVQRADEITELLAYYVKSNKKEPKEVEAKGDHIIYKNIYGLSNQLNKGLKDIFESGRFDEYQYAKYNRETEIKLRDALFLSHPKPKDQKQKDLFNKIANNNLETPYTWEVELSKAGQEGRGDKKEVWEELLDSGKLGYMALLRNLRNFVQVGVSNFHMEKVAERISNYNEVKRSKQLPFRFLSAYRSLGQDIMVRSSWGRKDEPKDGDFVCPPIFLEALEKAVKFSIENIPMFENENVLIATDVSGSMQRTISPRSQITNYDIGALMAMLLQTRCATATAGMFGDTWKVLYDLPKDNVLRSTNEIHRREGEVGYSTNGWKVLEWAVRLAKMDSQTFERIMIFTDCQMWNSSGSEKGSINSHWKEYKKLVPESKLYLFNLAPYGGTPIDMRNGDVHLISGWSDRIFNVLADIERGGESLDEIKEIKL